MIWLIRWCTLLMAVLVSACGAEEDANLPAAETAGGSPPEMSAAYEVVLGNAITDTLRGNATFGRVRDPQSDAVQLVIRLRSGFDFAGGVLIARESDELPEEGTYDLEPDTVRMAAGNQFTIVFREGMLRDLRSYSGTLTLSTVTDSLIVGRFDAALRGYISEGTRELESGEVHAVGRFRADRGMAGYVIGL